MTPDFRHRVEYKEYMETTQFSARITVLSIFWTAVMFCYLLMFYYLQVVQAGHYGELAEQNRIRKVVVPPARGAVLDRYDRVIARNRPSFEVLVTPETAENLEETLLTLAPVIGDDIAVLKDRLAAAGNLPDYKPVVIGSDVSLAAASFIEARRADLPGVTIRMSQRRYYPGGEVSSHVLGYVGEITEAMLETPDFQGLIQGDIVGKSGLERVYNAVLQGERGERQIIVNSGGRVIDELVGGIPAVPGQEIRLTINLDMQRELEEAFEDRVGAAVFMDPRTGEILAMTSRPGFDPNVFARRFSRQIWQNLLEDPRHPLQNRPIQSAYSPGSTFKPVMAAAALEEGVATPATVFNCAGSGVFHGRRFRCHEREGHGPLDMKEAIKKSCNIYFYNLGSRLGIDAVSKYARKIGLGSRTGIDLRQEVAGLVPSAEWKEKARGERWYPSETISVSIGGGPLTITPLQMAVVQSYIATDGRRVTPHLRRGAVPPPVGEADGVISRRSLRVIREAEWAVVNEDGTGWRAKIEGRDVCGKTGTAQIASASANVPEEELPPEMRDHAWFVGFAPRDDARVAFAVIVEHAGHGGEWAAPITRRVLMKFFESEERPPVEEPVSEQVADAGTPAP